MFDVGAQSNKAIILVLVFFLQCPRWGHSSFYFVWASWSHFVPVQNNKNIQDCLLAGLVSARMNGYRGHRYLRAPVKGLRWY